MKDIKRLIFRIKRSGVVKTGSMSKDKPKPKVKLS